MMKSSRRYARRKYRFVIRCGVTLIEILVVIGVVSLLLAILLPAVQHSREASLRLQCGNQLRQLAVAAQNYESSFGVFPTKHFLREIQPYIETQNQQNRVSLFGCPSDGNNAIGLPGEGKVSYAINAGLGSRQYEHAGIVSKPRRYTRTAEVTDGLSNTAMIGEKLSFPWYAPQVVAWDELRGDWNRTFLFFRAEANSPDEFSDECRSLTIRPLGVWFFTEEYHHLMPPNSRSCLHVNDEGMVTGGDFSVGANAGSVHNGGTHIAFSDGSVRFIHSEIETSIWRAYGTRSGGEAF